jgi:hypothetical protein
MNQSLFDFTVSSLGLLYAAKLWVAFAVKIGASRCGLAKARPHEPGLIKAGITAIPTYRGVYSRWGCGETQFARFLVARGAEEKL